MTPRRYLARGILALLLGTVLALTAAQWLMLTGPALQGLAGARTDRLAADLASRLDHPARNAERLLGAAAAWLGGKDLSLDHRTLNRRFIPLLQQCPQIASLRIGSDAGSEWTLSRAADGSWLNRLSSPDDRDGTRRFLYWRDADTLLREQRRPSRYDPRQHPWLREALANPPGGTLWSPVHRLPDGGGLGITAARRIPAKDDHDLVVSLDLRLADAVHRLVRLHPARHGLTLLMTGEGRVLALDDLSTANGAGPHPALALRPVLGVALGPLRQGVDLWLSRGERPLGDHLVWFAWQPWYVGFRRLELGDRPLWLGVYLPWREVLPELYPRLAVVVLVLLSALLAGSRLARRFAAALGRP